MGSSRLSRRLAGLVAFACIAGTAAPALALADPGTGFTYQGSLSQNGSPVTGLRDMRFRLYDAATGGTPIETVQAFNVDISGGLFSVEVDFGAGPWTANEQLWVEIEAGPADQSQSYEVIGRQKLTATPYALNTRGIDVEANNNITVGATLSLENPAESTWSVFSGSQGRFGIQDTTGPNTRFLIDSAGKVGIGTLAPARLLHLDDGFVIGSDTIQPNTDLLISSQDAGLTMVSDQSGSVGSFLDLMEQDGAGALIDNWSMIRRTPAENSRLEFRYGPNRGASVNDLVMSMLPNGNVGIGTDEPTWDLTIAGTVGADEARIDEARIVELRATKGAVGLFAFGRADTELQVVRDSGRVGLRVEPSGVNSDAEAAIFNGDVRLGHVEPGNQDTLFVNRIEANPRAGTTGPDFMSIIAGGIFMPTIVGVGGTISNGETQLVVQADDDAFRTSIFKALTPAFAEVFDIRTNGLVVCNGGVICASDERLKHDIRTISSPLDSVLALRGVTFAWNDDHPSATQGEQIGFIAQEVERVLPQLVEEGPDGIKAMNYANLTAVLVEAVKEQQAGIEARDARINDLEARLDALEVQAASADKPGLFGASVLWPIALVGGVGGLALASRRNQGRSEHQQG